MVQESQQVQLTGDVISMWAGQRGQVRKPRALKNTYSDLGEYLK